MHVSGTTNAWHIMNGGGLTSVFPCYSVAGPPCRRSMCWLILPPCRERRGRGVGYVGQLPGGVCTTVHLGGAAAAGCQCCWRTGMTTRVVCLPACCLGSAVPCHLAPNLALGRSGDPPTCPPNSPPSNRSKAALLPTSGCLGSSPAW